MQLVSSSRSRPSLVAKYAKQAARLAQQLARGLYLFGLGVRDGRNHLARYQALSRLSDGALAKRGLARGDIARAALDEIQTRR